VFKTHIDGDTTFAWLIVPGNGPIPNVKAELLTVDDHGVTVKVDDITVHIPIKHGQAKVE